MISKAQLRKGLSSDGPASKLEGGASVPQITQLLDNVAREAHTSLLYGRDRLGEPVRGGAYLAVVTLHVEVSVHGYDTDGLI